MLDQTCRRVAQNAALRRRCSIYRRRQNLYAKTTAGLPHLNLGLYWGNSIGGTAYFRLRSETSARFT
ncbi:MAG: hypothetical protein DCF21_13755 [Leptolyngbya sp.]|nr:MAG: hypothetical protein DCF21_13755 [Leptolyngbya sp.]